MEREMCSRFYRQKTTYANVRGYANTRIRYNQAKQGYYTTNMWSWFVASMFVDPSVEAEVLSHLLASIEHTIGQPGTYLFLGGEGVYVLIFEEMALYFVFLRWHCISSSWDGTVFRLLEMALYFVFLRWQCISSSLLADTLTGIKSPLYPPEFSVK